MALNSVQFIMFFFSTLIFYYIFPRKIKNLWLLLANLFFYVQSGIKYIIVILFVALFSYIYGLIIEKFRKKVLVGLGIVTVLVPLITLKYIDFIVNSVLNLFRLDFNYDNYNFVVPLGISFFTMQVIAYIIDVYKGKIKAEKNIINYFAFVTLFVYILSGPIERAGNILPQLKKDGKFDYKNFCHGLQMILWGFIMKLVLAERFKIVADLIFNDYTNYAGLELIIGITAFSAQLYFDFAGYSNIALGTAQTFNIKIIQNFNQPYFSKNTAEFWRRWHISFSSWLKDYLYIPLGGNRKGKIRKYINIIIVFTISGLWHGASVNFVIWGIIHGVYQVIGALTAPIKDGLIKVFKIRSNAFSYKLFQCLCTFVLVDFAWIFFRAPNLNAALDIIKRVFMGFSLSGAFGIKKVADYPWRNIIGYNLTTSQDTVWMSLGLSQSDFILLLLGTLFAILISVIHYRGNSIRKWIDQQNLVFRWILYTFAIVFVLTYGIYGAVYSSKSFIYANF